MGDIIGNKTYNNSFSSNKSYLCFTPANRNVTLFGELEYEDDLHVKKRYYFIHETFTNSTTLIDLYNLLSIKSTSFVINLYDSSSIPINDAYMKLEKKYLELNDYLIVEMAKTDEFGTSILHFVSEDDTYKISFYDSSGNLLYTPKDFHAICVSSVCSLSYTIPYSIALNPFQGLTEDDNFNYTLSNVNETIYLVYNSQNGTGYDVLFEVNALNIINDTLRVCSESKTTSSSGIFSCNVSNSSFDNFLVKIWINEEDNAQITQYLSKKNTDFQKYGAEGIFYTIIIVLTLTLLLVWNWILCLLGAGTGLIISMWLHFIPGTISTISYIIIVIIYLIVTGGKSESR